MPKGLSEAVNLKRTDIAMVKRKRIKGQPMIYKALHTKLNTEHEHLTKNKE